MTDRIDVAIIGAGPGGYVAAIRAAQLGLRVAVIEKDQPGGVCLNWGCIPSKNLIHQAAKFRGLADMEAVGVAVERAGLDYARVQAGSRAVVKTLTNGVAGLLKRNKVTYIKGRAKIAARGRIVIDGETTLECSNIIVATGSRPMEAPSFEFDHEQVISSDDILALTELPKSVIVLGAGAIGCEFAYIFNSFGVDVTLVEAMAHILPGEDFEACAVVDQCFRRDGIVIHRNTRATGLERNEDSVTVQLATGDGSVQSVTAEKALVVFGRTPLTAGLGLEEVGVEMDERGYIETGAFNQTSVVGIYAIGDITKTPALAHVASREGEIAVEHIAGHKPRQDRIDPALVPSAIYCEPQLAGFGLREDQAKARNLAFKKSVFKYIGAGKTIAIGKPEGLVKLLCDPDSGELLGCHVVGHDATEIIHELLLARQGELLAEDIESVIHAHPTISEAVMEATRGVGGKPIHA